MHMAVGYGRVSHQVFFLILSDIYALMYWQISGANLKDYTIGNRSDFPCIIFDNSVVFRCFFYFYFFFFFGIFKMIFLNGVKFVKTYFNYITRWSRKWRFLLFLNDRSKPWCSNWDTRRYIEIYFFWIISPKSKAIMPLRRGGGGGVQGLKANEKTSERRSKENGRKRNRVQEDWKWLLTLHLKILDCSYQASKKSEEKRNYSNRTGD